MNFYKRLFLFIRLLPLTGIKRAAYLKNKSILYFQGENCNFTTIDFGTEPYLISIHNNVEVASKVRFLTHDDSCLVIQRSDENSEIIDKVGCIEIFDNCFIGAHSLIMPNLKIGPNSIVAAGSVVTKDVPPNSIVGGNPARVIGDYFVYAEKLKRLSKEFPWIELLNDRKKNKKEIIELRKKYFWKNV